VGSRSRAADLEARPRCRAHRSGAGEWSGSPVVLDSRGWALRCANGCQPATRWQYSATVPRISSADFVQAKGLGFLFHSLIHWRMSASGSVTLRWADLRSLRFVSSANQRSDQVQPRCAGRREVQVEARVPEQPFPDRRGLAGCVVTQDEVQVQV
jgi:hypothetical protein